ncbi:Eco57I restriction-modification methylase domain-containing protein [Methylolobus aquaticus]
MSYPSIRIEGAILSPDILERIEESPGQRAADFGLESSVKVKDEIARAWADAQDYWRIFQRKLETLRPESPATTETRQQWIMPLLGLLGYQLEFQSGGVELNGKKYPISHRVTNRGSTPIHILGCREPAGLDRKPEKAASRMSAHAMVQEYLNLTDQVYGLVTNGRILRLLRDSSRLIKLTYLEFDLDRIFTDGLFADFAVMYRLLHASRLPTLSESNAESWIERYHQDSLDSGARIRDGLSRAVESAIRDFANGFLQHPDNDTLRQLIAAGRLTPDTYYQHLLRLIYRILFLLVIEERDLVFPSTTEAKQRDMYDRYYSLQRLRRLSEKRYLADPRRHDLWLSLRATFRLFEAGGPGEKLGLQPLAGDLFGPLAIGPLASCMLGNNVLLGCLRSLGVYQHPDNCQLIRVNYAALNVEEFGSVYEGLLEYQPVFVGPPGPLPGQGLAMGSITFDFAQGGQRAATGSHYTPDDLVQPLLQHSIDYLIADKLKESDAERALLSLRVADISCGSGHILLAAARHIATELAIVRTGEEQPSPLAVREALREVIRECIYGVDLNPLAVELCKVALWLEAHIPGEPLNFLDHHIKCGNAIVGFAHRDELERGVPDEAFATLPGDDKDIASLFRKRNKEERGKGGLVHLDFSPEIRKQFEAMLKRWRELSALPEQTPEQIETKKRRFQEFTHGQDAQILSEIASVPVAQFFLPKTQVNKQAIITDAEYRLYRTGQRAPQGQGVGAASALAAEKRFFHWFLEFPEIMERGGFDCVLGNPPYLGRAGIRSAHGNAFCAWVQWQYAPAGISDLIVYFVQRIYDLLRPKGFAGLITTNSIKDGDVRKDGLDIVTSRDGQIIFAISATRWPGRANLFVSLLSLHKGSWKEKSRLLDGREVPHISTLFQGYADLGEPKLMNDNKGRMCVGTFFMGNGFLLDHKSADEMLKKNPKLSEVIFPVINGSELNSEPEQSPGRQIINFFDWPLSKANGYGEAFLQVESKVKPYREAKAAPGNWWQHWRPRLELYKKIRNSPRCFVAARTTKHLNFSAAITTVIFTDATYVFTTDRWDLYAVVQSTVHEVWARKYSGALKQDLRYSPSDCFETFPFPAGLWLADNPALADIGERYHEHRRALMRQLWLGLTDIYNLFHTRDLTTDRVAKVSKKSPEESERGYQGILDLRGLHRELDCAIRDAYGWTDLDLGHHFHEIETLPENDRIRYTISPSARREILKRLLQLNHKHAVQEAATPTKKARTRARKAKADDSTADLFE